MYCFAVAYAAARDTTNGEVMQSLGQGKNTSLPASRVRLVVSYTRPATDLHAQLSAMLLNQHGRVRSDNDLVFTHQPSSSGVHHEHDSIIDDRVRHSISFDRTEFPSDVSGLLVALSVEVGDVGSLADLKAELVTVDGRVLATFDMSKAGTESCLVVARVFRRLGMWRIRC